MKDWRVLFDQRRFDELTNGWLFLDQTEQRDLLEALRALVPKVIDTNGLETIERYATPAEMTDIKLKGAAEILQLGELAATVDGDPRDDIQDWSEMRDEAEALLIDLVSQGEVTLGANTLSRRSHAEDALLHLRKIDVVLALGQSQVADPDEAAWLDHIVAAVAWNSFIAGRHAQVAYGKEFEASAIRGTKVAGGAKNSAHGTNKRHEKARECRLDRMRQLAPAMGVSKAAAQCETEGLGNRTAIARQYDRWKNKSDT